MKSDILERKDVELLITQFYAKVREDELLAPVFAHVDWEHHTPVIIDFWCSILFGDATYRNNPFEKHKTLPIASAHFNRWLDLFTRTLAENFAGGNTDEALRRAHSIAGIFQHKLGLIK
jgi:hemoglobin